MKTDDIVEQALKEHEDRLQLYRDISNQMFDVKKSAPLGMGGVAIIEVIERFDEMSKALDQHYNSACVTRCSHTINHYVGFSEEYDYCTKCGEKL